MRTKQVKEDGEVTMKGVGKGTRQNRMRIELTLEQTSHQ
jgi:hypothetical protein